MISQVGAVIEECRTLLHCQDNVKLFFVKQSANIVAHNLVRTLYSFSDRVINGRYVPVEVKNFILYDLFIK